MMEHKVNRLIEQGHYEEALLQLNSLGKPMHCDS